MLYKPVRASHDLKVKTVRFATYITQFLSNGDREIVAWHGGKRLAVITHPKGGKWIVHPWGGGGDTKHKTQREARDAVEKLLEDLD